MNVIVNLTIIPIGAGTSLSAYVAECDRIFKKHGLTHHLHANGTNIEGDWGEVMEAVRRCHERLHEMGAPRLYTNLSIHTRNDREQRMEEKVASVEAQLAE